MAHESDDLDLLLSWALRESIPDEDPPPGVWEAIEAKLAQGVSSGEVRPLPWRRKARVWLGEALASVQAVLFFRLDEARLWAGEQSTPASVMVSIYGASWPLYCYREATLNFWWALTPTIR
jgi:hypothetical protein